MRLTLVAHGETEYAREGVFGDCGRLRPEQDVQLWQARTRCFCGPEPVCPQTAALMGLEPAGTVPELRQPDFGSWVGQSLAEVIERDPDGLEVWLNDPTAVPHGGESLAAVAARVGATLDAHPWPAAGAVVIVSSFTARAALAHGLGARPDALLRADVAPLGSVRLSRHAGRWRLTGLHRPPDPAVD